MTNTMLGTASQSEKREQLPVNYSGDRVKSLRMRFACTQYEFGKILGVNSKTIARWEKEGVSGLGNVALAALDRYGGDFLRVSQPEADKIDYPEYKKTPRESDIVAMPKDFGSTEINFLRKRLGVSRTDFAKLLNVTPGTVDKLGSGRLKASGPLLVVLAILWTRGKDGFSDFLEQIHPATRTKNS